MIDRIIIKEKMVIFFLLSINIYTDINYLVQLIVCLNRVKLFNFNKFVLFLTKFSLILLGSWVQFNLV